ncbi:serine hydrolase domain-containing protein [Dethiobacter alkaliphilus]|uniref:serine hydrolase domain-containing protein n=1 Tax=Dethiobacter alkaliphilus TaxID=427926 RepID=UPI002226F8D9|nr:serine hydrolase domain-containing protein [Dethiobacter alkaliphilus]MCW3488581.1 beta-lactamase family protein [Dethiobacter alkaliphilus]
MQHSQPKGKVHSPAIKTSRWSFVIRISIISVIIIALVISNARIYPTGEVEEGASLETFKAHLDERIPALMEVYAVPGVNVALVKGGEVVWSGVYGYADMENGRKMTTDTYQRVESISKSLTAWGVMSLVEQGKIELDRPVEQYLHNWELPSSDFPEEKVTVRQLLTHTAGFPLGDVFERYLPAEEMPSLEDSLSGEAYLVNEPGSTFHYSNTGYNLLELLIEEVTGRDFAEYMEEDVLMPLGMSSATFTWSEELEPAVPVGYDVKGGAMPVYVYPEKGSGGLLTTAEDVASFISAGMISATAGEAVLSSQSISKLYTPAVDNIGVYDLVFDSYGLGHYIEVLPNGMQAVAHGGQGGGVMTHFHSVPETGDGIVILANSQRSWPFFAYILSDWAVWRGLSSVGMGMIIVGQKVLWGVISLILFFSLLQVWQILQNLIAGRRKFAPLAKESRFLRLGQLTSFIALVSLLKWAASQDYLFLTSVFPVASSWLGVSILAFAVVLLLLSLLPYLIEVFDH